MHEVEVYLLEGESIQPDAVRLFRSRPPNYHNPNAEPDGQPGLAMKWMEVRGPLHEVWPPAGHQLLFGDLALQARDEPGNGRMVRVLSDQPREDARRLLTNFLSLAYRTEVLDQDVERFLRIFDLALVAENDFAEAMIMMYTAVLCSPEFISLREPAGHLDGAAIASRLSYFLWNSAPDAVLREAACSETGFDGTELARQTERMLDDPRSRRFVKAFSDYWLDLRRVNDASPDERLYPDYYLDDYLADSSILETQEFLADLLARNAPIRNLVDADYAFVNERLAEHYALPDVQGVAIRRVALPADSVRGGLLTQASILKVTANGTTTSPVKRGAWVMERILGKKPAPPPPSVPSIEPDTRGAVTIRQQLAAHSSDDSCAVCHREIDPPGFALENFDVFGGWRTRYRVWPETDVDQPELSQTTAQPGLDSVEGFGKNGQPFLFMLGQEVDAAGELAEGAQFKDIRRVQEPASRGRTPVGPQFCEAIGHIRDRGSAGICRSHGNRGNTGCKPC